jgi:hypothetical protein
MTFIAVGISLMLFGSIQMMSAGLQENLVGGLEDRQSWDAQVYIMADGESDVIDWAEEKGALHELLIELPLGIVEDPSGIERTFSLVGLDTFKEGMRSVSLIEGTLPDSAATPPQVIIDEGSMAFLDWNLGEVQTVNISGIE